jgi:hypothetical protein
VKYRLYIDEVGNPDLDSSQDPNHRYLSLSGVIFELGYVNAVVFPKVEELKKTYFGSHPDEPIILHRKEVMNGKFPFQALKDPATREAFDRDILALLSELDYTLITVAIDKLDHKNRYTAWRFDPYHYCLRVMLERFVPFLEKHNAKGDVMAESRAGKEDIRLKENFERLILEGTDFVAPQRFLSALTSRQLKVKPKSSNISGLQIADLLAHPSFRSMLTDQDSSQVVAPFGKEIVDILIAQKYHRSQSGQIAGYGKKWLP